MDRTAAVALESLQDYIAKEKPRAAWEVAQMLKLVVRQLEDQPRIGRPGRIRATYEPIIHGLPYIVPYRRKKKEVQILSAYHTSRKWPETFD